MGTRTAAAGIALINCIANIGGYIGPQLMGYLKDATGGYQSGLYFLAALGLAGALITVIGVRETPAKLAPGVMPAAE